MADINKIKLPSGSEYNLKDYRIPGVDTTPTSGSDNIVTSGGIYQSVIDASLVTSAALNDLNTRLDTVQSNLDDIDVPGTLTTTSTTALSTATNESLSGSINLHKVAKTGTYSDLIGKPTIPAAPGTLNTTATTAQSTNASETLSGSVTLHKIAKTGTYSDLIGTLFKAGSSGTASVVHNHGNDGHPSTATGSYSLAFGVDSNATNESAIALGSNSNASGDNSFAAMGGSASGTSSIAIGTGTYSQNYGEVAIGRYNSSYKASDTTGNAGNTAFSVGIGVRGGRSNAVQVMQNGDVYVKGVGSYTGANYSSASTLQSVVNSASPNDSTITIQMNDSTVDSFTTNAASAKTIDLGTVITSHQDISGKANVATTLSGYGITDATISGQTVTLGSNSVTVPQILSGTADPTSAQGNNGDIYIKLSS